MADVDDDASLGVETSAILGAVDVVSELVSDEVMVFPVEVMELPPAFAIRDLTGEACIMDFLT